MHFCHRRNIPAHEPRLRGNLVGTWLSTAGHYDFIINRSWDHDRKVELPKKIKLPNCGKIDYR